ncbi:MAG: hypothetical protein KC584_08835, partial [Nitrospira sp.]|nr:hypothetical protein [Nitrospira sp.]
TGMAPIPRTPKITPSICTTVRFIYSSASIKFQMFCTILSYGIVTSTGKPCIGFPVPKPAN